MPASLGRLKNVNLFFKGVVLKVEKGGESDGEDGNTGKDKNEETRDGSGREFVH